MTRQERRLATALAHRLLDGVGDGPGRVEPSERVIHVKRPLTVHEEGLLPAGWCELEAVDPAGPPGLLDEIARGVAAYTPAGKHGDRR
jgi:hypothetical protein